MRSIPCSRSFLEQHAKGRGGGERHRGQLAWSSRVPLLRDVPCLQQSGSCVCTSSTGVDCLHCSLLV
eukprot:4462982-Prorocentrum_lima.AAC.1